MYSRANIFEKGKRYRVIADCEISFFKRNFLHAGEILFFHRFVCYHAFDKFGLYLFIAASDGRECLWQFHDHETDAKWQEVFEIVDDHSASHDDSSVKG
jgi:hypothetical protein